jgi:hypothetical protein
MNEQELSRRMLHQFGIRIEEEMKAYAQRMLAQENGKSFQVMGTQARTGVPVSAVINSDEVRNAQASQPKS